MPDAARARFDELLPALAQALGLVFVPETGAAGPCGRLRTPDSGDIVLHVQRGRLKVFKALNGLADYLQKGEVWPKITLAPDRPPAALARDIQRRVITPGAALHARLLERQAARQREVETARQHCAALLQAGGRLLEARPAWRAGDDDRRFSFVGARDAPVSIAGSVTDSSAELNLSDLPPALAVEIIALIRRCTSEGPAASGGS